MPVWLSGSNAPERAQLSRSLKLSTHRAGTHIPPHRSVTGPEFLRHRLRVTGLRRRPSWRLGQFPPPPLRYGAVPPRRPQLCVNYGQCTDDQPRAPSQHPAPLSQHLQPAVVTLLRGSLFRVTCSVPLPPCRTSTRRCRHVTALQGVGFAVKFTGGTNGRFHGHRTIPQRRSTILQAQKLV